MISHRHAVADEDHSLVYVDANNLYGHAMCRYLPIGNFDLKSGLECNHFDLSRISEDAQRGFILEVDVDCPKEVHEELNDYPLAPEKLSVTSNCMTVQLTA